MKNIHWVAISGSWRKSSPELEHDVRQAVAEIMKRGDGIVSGGALGVDFVATKEALRHNPEADRIKIIIPSPLEIFAKHYRKRADEGVITHKQAEALIELLTDLKNRRLESLIEMNHQVLNKDTYYDRNSKALEYADELMAFQVNDSQGTQDTIDKAKKLGLKITLKKYTVE